MRRYTITVNDTTKVIDVEAAGGDRFRVQLDGRLIDVTLVDHSDLAHSPIVPAITPQTSTAPAVPAQGTPTPAPVAAPASGGPAPARPAPTASAPAAGGGGGGGRDKMTAPMPGVILSVNTAVGKTVQRGEALMVLEAMKMKNELKAPKDGTIAEIYVSEGQQVKFGETLVRFEA
ncbi:MAG: biotin/lipoyl-containing protein [Propionibacteriaceae bacterium]|nr:biotin/lipoyl-containing protein [Propionibacteriaceae bacterium]